MKRILLSLTFLCYLTIGTVSGQTNGECSTGGCAFGGSQFPSTTQSTTSSSFVTVATNIYAGEWQRYEVISGRTYEWSLCASDGGNASYDSQLTLYNDTDNQLCYSDDYCSDDAKIAWTATYTGFVKTRVNVYNCGTNSTNTTLVWRSLAPSATAVNCSGGGVTGTYCYGNNDNTSWGYTASDNARILTLTFNAGGIESCCDDITIYDGSDNTGAVLYSGNNGGNLAGLTVTSTGPDIFMQMSSDGSVSCVSGSGCCTSQWDWDVFCASSTTTVTCGSITNDTYCYDDNDNSSWGYTASDNARTLTLTFNTGGIESCCDNITIYDGSDNTGIMLFSGANGGNLAGISVTSTGPNVFMEMSSDGSVSCASGSSCCTNQWDWEVECTTPSNNECFNAELVNDGETVTGSTATATNVEALTPCQNGGGGQNCSGTGQGITDFSAGVWFKYTSGSSETIVVSTDNASTNFDTEIIVYQGACGGLTCVGGDDDSGAGVNSIFCWESTANFAPVDYYIYVDGHSGSTGNYEFTINTMAILPVELALFEGETMKDYNLLRWETSSEANTEMHQIERSVNGHDSWKMIGEVAAAGNSSEDISYSLKDENPLPVAYYRLKSVDFGGYIEYSDILLLQRKTDKIEMISIAPNPTNDLVNIDFFTPDTDTYTITVTNMVGQLLIENQQDLEEGNQRQNIDLSNFDNGIYFFSISNGNESSVYKIIKQ